MILAQQIAPLLAGKDWGIGGSLLLWKLGIEPRPNDLDIMTTAAHFGVVSRPLEEKFGAGVRTPHPAFRSAHFARFSTDAGVSIDLFAGVRVERGGQSSSWNFDPRSVMEWRGLPWMRPADWLELYELFDRPERVNALIRYLAARAT